MAAINRISPSMLGTFLRFERWWDKKYRQQLPPEPMPVSLPFLAGCIVHASTAAWVKAGDKLSPLPLVAGFLDDFLKQNPGQLEFQDQVPLIEALKRVQLLGDQVREEITARVSRILLCEHELEVTLPNGMVFRGFPDLLGIDKATGETVLVDLKIGGRLKSQGDVDGMFNQLAGYAWLCRLNDMPASRVDVLTGSITWAARPRTKGFEVGWVKFEPDRLLGDFQDNLRALADFVFFETPSRRTGIFHGTCSYCPYQGGCLAKCRQNAA